MEVDVSIQLRSPRWKPLLRPYCKTVRMACGAALQPMTDDGCRMTEMTVVLADDAFIRELNHTYRGYDKPTNVLSFPSSGIRHPSSDDSHLGDLVLALETIEREAKEQHKTFRHHAMHLLVHGTLHLLGYDHEKAAEAQVMEKIEIKVLKKLGVSNPYL